MSTKILIVRSSSLGDLVHMLPAISDIAKYVPDAQIDWVVEEVFQEIPSWHPAVHEVIPIAHRKWRKSWWSQASRQARQAFKEKMNQRHYDVVLDMQALMKSIWVVRQTHGERHGLDWKSAREPLASLFYDVKHRVEFWQPAVTRQRLLASLAFHYTYEGEPDFGLQRFTTGVEIEPYAVIMPSASRDDKLYPEKDWHAIFDKLTEKGLSLKLLAGNERESERAKALVAHYDNAEVLPRMNLTGVAQVLAKSHIMVGLDSGLTHLSAALGRPTIGIYSASTPVRTPLVGAGFTASLGDRGVPPSREIVLNKVEQALSL
ncbi:lipopolysaccharide heptosyltransferase I [Pelistega sp. NLN82]|uniref:Lipopolysaccharide heptosyltransferase 1 n=1 Tax=Pelistega ratti TaxID=2652177 RepID=A0A6L9Y5D6_9BURK|nr:lipopolysaccharide heptosyltransferase I [Pelistega ratti]NEN75563.1 lipopolysaccharide heptosyltransferase I [Pelistega ratti]